MMNQKISIRSLLFFLLLLTIQVDLICQEAQYFKGYVDKINTPSFGYHSPLPDIKRSLLIRGREEYGPITWSTESVPSDYPGEMAHFIWMYGKDVTHQPSTFHLSFNGNRLLTFQNSGRGILGEEKVEGVDGSLLTFNNTMLDKYGDQMGFAILRVPVSMVKKGMANEIVVTSNPDKQDTWYMTFEASLEPSIDVYQNMVVIKDGDQRWHNAVIEILHLGPADKVEVEVDDINRTMDLHTGYNRLDINLPIVKDNKTFAARLRIGNQPTIVREFTLSPVREWEVFLIQHTHSDIGYTRPQQEILPEHLRYIDHALDYCDMTDDYPDAAQFRWTCETSWSVKEYLEKRPQSQVDRLVSRIKEGRIEATGMYFNFSEIIDEQAVAYQTKYLKMLKNAGIDVMTAMQNDVNGAAWSFIDVFKNTGVKYLNMGLHGHRARKPFQQPTAFWWESPAENMLLAFRAEHYQHGNKLRLISGSQDVFCQNLTTYLGSLEEKEYPYDKVALQFSGYVTDNSPPSTKVCDIIREWNEKYEWPKLRSSLAKDFLMYLDEVHGDEIEKRKEAWPDWWTDGVGSAANETKQARKVHTDVSATSALLAMIKMQGLEAPKDVHAQVEAIYDDLLFYDEHTYGAAESIRDPLVQNSVNQWNMKSAYVWDALKRSSMLQEQALAYLESNLPKYEKPTIAVYNTLNWRRNALVRIFIDKETIKEGEPFSIKTVEGQNVPVEIVEQRVEGAYYDLWVEDLPPMGYKNLIISIGEQAKNEVDQMESEMENRFYRIRIDTDAGGIVALYDKELSIELLDDDSTYSLGEVIHEKLKNRHDLERLTSSLRDTVYRPLNQEYKTIRNLQVMKTSNGTIYKSIHLHGELPETIDDRGIDIEIRLYHHEKKIDILYKMVKLSVHDPEGIYVSFPFDLPEGQLHFEVQGGVISPGKEQLPGSASDWNTVQNFASVRNDDHQIVFVSDEVPLVQFGDLNIGRYYYRLDPVTNHIYSWVLNNYWVTNFKASQEGELRWTYSITSSDDTSDRFAMQYGRNNRVSAPARLILPEEGAEGILIDEHSFINLGVPNLLLVNMSPSLDNKGVVLQLRETDGDHAILDILRIKRETGAFSIQEVNVLEESMGELTGPFLIEHYDTRFIKIIFE
jgi:alpha-mannosidase